MLKKGLHKTKKNIKQTVSYLLILDSDVLHYFYENPFKKQWKSTLKPYVQFKKEGWTWFLQLNGMLEDQMTYFY